MMTTITRWVLAHRRWVAAFWVVLTIVGVATVGQATKSFSSEFSVPGRQGFETNSQIQRLFHQGGRTSPLIPVVTLPAGTPVTSPAVHAGLLNVEQRLQRAIPGLRTASFASTGNRAFVSRDGRTTFVLAYPPPDNESFGNAFRVQWELFLRDAYLGKPFGYDLFDGARGVQLAQLALDSAREGRRLPVPPLD